MTTTSERLLQIAEQYDQKAAALRLAAQELHGERTLTATHKLGQRLNAAMATRAATRNGHNNNSAEARATKKERRAIVHELLSDGAVHTVADVTTRLAERHQIHQGRNIIWNDMRDLGAKPDPNVKYGYRLTTSSNGNNGTGAKKGRDTHGEQTEGRRKVLLALLRKGPQQIKTLQLALNDAGYMIQRDRTRQFITDHVPEAHCEGTAGKALWMLGTITGTGKLSTKKPTAKTTKKRTAGYSSKVREQRQRSANWLAGFDTTTPGTPPKDMPHGAVGVYVRRGYLRRKDDGYVRTAKVFSLDLP
jgi:hypothetical protein